jgi:tetratricopeptide (TPR) repeat protein
MTISPKSAEAEYKRGNEYEAAGKMIEAEKCYQKAAKKLPEAMLRLGDLSFAKDDEKSIERAVDFYKRAKDMGSSDATKKYPEASLFLGNLYFNKGDQKNVEKAAKQYKIAAKLGLPQGENNYAYCLGIGVGVPQNPRKSLKYYKRAAKHLPESMFSVGTCYEDGVTSCEKGVTVPIVPINLMKAKKHYTRALEKGNSDAKEALEKITTKLKGLLDIQEGTKDNFESRLSESLAGKNDSDIGPDAARYFSKKRVQILDADKNDLMIAPPDFILEEGLSSQDTYRLHVKHEFTKFLDIFLTQMGGVLSFNDEIPQFDDESKLIKDLWEQISKETPKECIEPMIQEFFEILKNEMKQEKAQKLAKVMRGFGQHFHVDLPKAVFVVVKEVAKDTKDVSNRLNFLGRNLVVGIQFTHQKSVKIFHDQYMINGDHQIEEKQSIQREKEGAYKTKCRYEIRTHLEVESQVSDLNKWTISHEVAIGKLPEHDQKKDPAAQEFLENLKYALEVGGFTMASSYTRKKTVWV